MDSNKIPQCWKHGQLVNFKGYGEDDKPQNPMVSAHHHQEDPSHVSGPPWHLPLRIVTEDRPQSLSTILEF